MKTFKIVDNDISDGYHTFEELYEHRNRLFINLCLSHVDQCLWKTDYPEWFLLVWNSPNGQISYHVQNKYLSLIDGKIKEDNGEYQWDGHTSDEVLFRLRNNAFSLDKETTKAGGESGNQERNTNG
jgi:hypothetical protein